jgi:hypothetical protein
LLAEVYKKLLINDLSNNKIIESIDIEKIDKYMHALFSNKYGSFNRLTFILSPLIIMNFLISLSIISRITIPYNSFDQNSRYEKDLLQNPVLEMLRSLGRIIVSLLASFAVPLLLTYFNENLYAQNIIMTSYLLLTSIFIFYEIFSLSILKKETPVDKTLFMLFAIDDTNDIGKKLN